MAVATPAVAITPPTPPEQTSQPTPLPVAPQDCRAVNGYQWDVRVAYAICMAESGGVAGKDNAGLNWDGSVDYGLMQINSIHADLVNGDLESLRRPEVNIKIAYALSRGGTNWTAWSAYNNGKYLRFL